MLEGFGWELWAGLVAAGVVAAFIGAKLVKAFIMLVGGGLLALITYLLLTHFGAGLATVAAASLVAFVLGAVIGWKLFKLAVAIPAGIAAGVAAAYLLGSINNIGVVIVLIFLSIGILYLLVEKLIALIMAMLGGALVFIGLYHLISMTRVSLAAAVLVFLAGLYYQYRHGVGKHKHLLF